MNEEMTIIIIIIIIIIIFRLKKKKNYSFKTLFTIPVDLRSTQFSLERVSLTKKNYSNQKHFISVKRTISL